MRLEFSRGQWSTRAGTDALSSQHAKWRAGLEQDAQTTVVTAQSAILLADYRQLDMLFGDEVQAPSMMHIVPTDLLQSGTG